MIFCTRPTSIQASFVQCLGFILRRHDGLLTALEPSPSETFQSCFTANHAGSELQAQAVQAYAEILSFWQKQAESQAPSGSLGEAAAAGFQKKAVLSEGVQRLADLQSKTLDLLLLTDSPNTAGHALSALNSLSHLGVLHPACAVPGLLAYSIVGCQALAPATRNLLLRLLETSPPLLHSRLNAAVNKAATHMERSTRGSGAPSDKLCFETVRQVYIEICDSKRMCEAFLDALTRQFEMLCAESATSSLQSSALSARLLFHMEILFCILARLPYRCEAEVSYVVRKASRFLSLRALPLLLDGGAAAPGHHCVPAVCAASCLLEALGNHLCTAASAERLLQESPDQRASEERSLPVGFTRRSAPDIAELLQILAGASSNDALLEAMVDRVPLDSPLLRGAVAASSGHSTGGRKRGRKGNKEETEQPRKSRRCKQHAQDQIECELGSGTAGSAPDIRSNGPARGNVRGRGRGRGRGKKTGAQA